MKTRTVLPLIVAGGVLAAMLVGLLPVGPSPVDVVTGATKKATPPATKPPTTTPRVAAAPAVYYYLVMHANGQMAARPMTASDAAALEKDLKSKEYPEARKQWLEEKQKWVKAMPGKDFPVPEPKTPDCQQVGRVPSNEKDRAKAQENLDRRLDMWDICVTVDHKGEKSVEALRRDAVFGRWHDLSEAYVDAVLAAKEKAGGAALDRAKGEASTEPVKPSIKVVQSQVSPKATADKYVEALHKKMAAEAEKAQGEKPKADAGAPKADAGQPKGDAGAGGQP